MAKKNKDKGIDQFKEFFDKPESFNNNDFYEMAEKWKQYYITHEDVLENFDDDEWDDICDRALGELERRAVVSKEFDEIGPLLEEGAKSEDPQFKIAVQEKWLKFMKNNQFDYSFSDEQISRTESNLNAYIEKVNLHERVKKVLKRVEAEYEKITERIDYNIVDNYERTGKRTVFVNLPGRKKFKGN